VLTAIFSHQKRNRSDEALRVVQEENDIEKLVWNQYLESSFLAERGSGYDANTSCGRAV
jgi:hypothetical protein